ncbi:hypothetical protein BDV98DRAFT_339209 [Pterulicium gracile]|uniref:Uncharacterized protein n=1 Tax=Pterulicium gracile TaxID=1884261 RepID=A0A5C3Q4M2_9AGAR|nr:hypothetical protein BDV98DRAFT_339209 [Pterula gracilis]
MMGSDAPSPRRSTTTNNTRCYYTCHRQAETSVIIGTQSPASVPTDPRTTSSMAGELTSQIPSRTTEETTAGLTSSTRASAVNAFGGSSSAFTMPTSNELFPTPSGSSGSPVGIPANGAAGQDQSIPDFRLTVGIIVPLGGDCCNSGSPLAMQEAQSSSSTGYTSE